MSDPSPTDAARLRALKLAHKINDITLGNGSFGVVDAEHDAEKCPECNRVADLISEFAASERTPDPALSALVSRLTALEQQFIARQKAAQECETLGVVAGAWKLAADDLASLLAQLAPETPERTTP